MGMITFMLFIIAMVCYMFYVHGRDALIEDDYYEQGMNYNTEFNATMNMLDANAAPEIVISPSQIIIKLKDSATYHLNLKRASNDKDDKTFNGSTVGPSNLILIERTDFPSGLWFLKLQWSVKGKDFLFRTNLSL